MTDHTPLPYPLPFELTVLIVTVLIVTSVKTERLIVVLTTICIALKIECCIEYNTYCLHSLTHADVLHSHTHADVLHSQTRLILVELHKQGFLPILCYESYKCITHSHIVLKHGFDTSISEYKIGAKNAQNSHLTTAHNVL